MSSLAPPSPEIQGMPSQRPEDFLIPDLSHIPDMSPQPIPSLNINPQDPNTVSGVNILLNQNADPSSPWAPGADESLIDTVPVPVITPTTPNPTSPWGPPNTARTQPNSPWGPPNVPNTVQNIPLPPPTPGSVGGNTITPPSVEAIKLAEKVKHVKDKLTAHYHKRRETTAVKRAVSSDKNANKLASQNPRVSKNDELTLHDLEYKLRMAKVRRANIQSRSQSVDVKGREINRYTTGRKTKKAVRELKTTARKDFRAGRITAEQFRNSKWDILANKPAFEDKDNRRARKAVEDAQHKLNMFQLGPNNVAAERAKTVNKLRGNTRKRIDRANSHRTSRLEIDDRLNDAAKKRKRIEATRKLHPTKTERYVDRRVKRISANATRTRSKAIATYNLLDNNSHMLGTDAKRHVSRKAPKLSSRAHDLETKSQEKASENARRRAKRLAKP